MNAEELFHAALARPPSERPALLTDACAGDESLRRRVEALLHAHESPASFLARSLRRRSSGCRSASEAATKPSPRSGPEAVMLPGASHLPGRGRCSPELRGLFPGTFRRRSLSVWFYLGFSSSPPAG